MIELNLAEYKIRIIEFLLVDKVLFKKYNFIQKFMYDFAGK